MDEVEQKLKEKMIEVMVDLGDYIQSYPRGEFQANSYFDCDA